MAIPVGIQLFGLRNEMAKDPEATIREIAKIGYNGIEPFDGAHGMKPEEFRALCDELSLTVYSLHTSFGALNDDGDRHLGIMKTLGVKYAVYAWIDADKLPGGENWEMLRERIPVISKKAAEYGIKTLYHNHDFEFNDCGGMSTLDRLYAEFTPDQLSPEFDVCWISHSGNDPVDYISRYKGRCHAVHLKDYIYTDDKREYDDDGNKIERPGFAFCPVGSGRVDMPAVLEASVRSGASWLIVEQDSPGDMTEFEAAAASREYLRGQGF